MTTLIRKNFTGRIRTPFKTTTRSMVEQQYKQVVDTHEIVKRFTRTGVIDHTTTKKPVYGDFSKLQDFHTSQNLVAQTTQYFEALPSDVRKQFNNQVSEFAQFMSNPENMEKAVSLGLAEAPKIEKPITVPIEQTPIVDNAQTEPVKVTQE